LFFFNLEIQPKADEAAQKTFKDEFGQRLEAHGVKRVFAMDEARFGLMTWFRRRWCPIGFRPPWIGQLKREWFWLYGAVEPATGESFFLFLPTLDQTCFEVFLQGLEQKVATETTALVMDQAAAHNGEGLTWPEELIPMALPPYSPELNPMERVFEALREQLANRVFGSLEELQAALTVELKKFWENPKVLVSLTSYPWWQKALAEPPAPTFPEKVVQFFKDLFRFWQAALQEA
jgi:transposase